MLKALVTGGAGFIGSHVAWALLKKGYQVRVLDDFSTGKRENLVDFIDEIELVQGNLVDEKTVSKVVHGVDEVFHIGAIPSVVRSVEEPLKVHHANVSGTLNVLLAAREHKVKRVVFSSSSSIYGNQPTLPKVETMTPEPLSPYAATKLSGEHYCSIFYDLYGVPTVSLRYFNVFGPRQDPNSLYSAVIPRFISAMLAGKPPTIYGDGRQTRDFTFVEDVVRANLLAAKAGPHALGKVYNIACGRTISLLDLAKEIQGILGVQLPPVFEPPRMGDVKDSLAAIERAEKDLGFQPKFSFRQGLEKTIEALSSQGKVHG